VYDESKSEDDKNGGGGWEPSVVIGIHAGKANLLAEGVEGKGGGEGNQVGINVTGVGVENGVGENEWGEGFEDCAERSEAHFNETRAKRASQKNWVS